MAEWAASGKSAEEMAAITGWSPYTLYRWRLDAGLGKKAKGASPLRAKLLPVPKPSSPVAGAWVAEVTVAGMSVRLAAGCPPSWVGQLVRELQPC